MQAPAATGNTQTVLQPLTELKGVGPWLEARLEKIGVRKVEDLLFLLPNRYEDRTRLSRIGTLRPGQHAVIEASVELAEVVYRRRRSLLCHVSDGTGGLILRFFYFSKAQQEQLVRGQRIRCYGEVRAGPGGAEMIHPEYRLLTDESTPSLEDTLTPVYPATEGLNQARLRNLTGAALGRIEAGTVPELLPDDVLKEFGFPALGTALRLLHHPPPATPLNVLATGRHPAQRRLAFEELLAHHLSLRRLRERLRSDGALPLSDHSGLLDKFTASLPFSLTGAQQRVFTEILDDLAMHAPMLRLVQGDVGSGKTVVAAAAAIVAVATGCQAAIMAPTELLAEQHYRTFSAWLAPLGIEPAWLTGSLTAAQRKASLSAIAAGSAKVIIGTHALFQEGVLFNRLALAIVDEQHRFGVHQRHALREKGAGAGHGPHQLIMTATPIPRTLAMTAYADLDVSTIDELPPGRIPVKTVAIPDSRRYEVVERVRDTCGGSQQAYWVCPLIGESEVLEAQAAENTAAKLAQALPELTVNLIHGRMKATQKDTVMQRFIAGYTDLLVATTVIEVGVDVPNANLMIIENAERLGLAQLHQLRGRVGRGFQKASCVLLYRSPMSQQARERVRILRETNDGFEVARRDLELRGPGDVLGTRQTGLMQMKIADVTRDADLLPDIQKTAGRILSEQSDLVDPLIDRWIGADHRYGNV